MNQLKYNMGDVVNYELGQIKGQGVIMGVSSNALPLLGPTYILKDEKMNTKYYPYDCFVCPELYLKDFKPNQ